MANALVIDNLWKEYQLGVISHGTLTRDLQAWIAKIRKKEDPNSKIGSSGILEKEQVDGDRFWALRGIDFSVREGEVLGVIGKNGAGKSTLLKIISRVTAPSRGSIKIRGRVASLLEVGTGFHPELTGRENIFLNGAILGMSKREINGKLDEIIDFSGIEHHIDTPVKRYSSGMYVRLAFAVAGHLEPEILIIDEVLAVGDAAFQKKCLGKMENISKQGRTILFVSHNLSAVRSLCPETLMLSKGKIQTFGKTEDVIQDYLSEGVRADCNGVVKWSENDAPGGDTMKLLGVCLQQNGVETGVCDAGKPIRFEILIDNKQKLRGARVVASILTQEGLVAFATSSEESSDHQTELAKGRHSVCFTIPADLLNTGLYYLRINAGIPNVEFLIKRIEVLSFLVEIGGESNRTSKKRWPGVLAPRIHWEPFKHL